MRLFGLVLVLCVGMAWACGSSGGGGPTAKGPMVINPTTAKWTFNDAASGKTVTGGIVGTVTAFGKEFTRYQVGATAAGSFRGIQADINWNQDYCEAVALVVPHAKGLTAPGVNVLEVQGDAPLIIDLNPPLGVPQVVTVPATVSFFGAPGTHIEAEATYTLVNDDATLETPMGTLSGVKIFEGSGTVLGTFIEGSVWYHPTYGVVGGDTDFPPPAGLNAALTEFNDPGDPTSTTGVTQTVKAISPSNPVFELDTYDIASQFDADKNQHAKMLLELRWADEALAKDPNARPGAIVEFGTVWGIYDYALVASPVSFLHPEENGKGYTFWIAYVNQAAKNESTNGISYHIRVSGGEMLASPLQVSGRIIYKRWKP